jgi:hypothetical protein
MEGAPVFVLSEAEGRKIVRPLGAFAGGGKAGRPGG